MSKTYQYKWPSVLITLSLALLIALTGVMTAPTIVEASSDNISFDRTPTKAKVRSGTANKKVAKVRASGIDQKRIRYSLTGHSAFRVGNRSGKVIYDGSPISAKSVKLTVTARDKWNQDDSASASFTVRVKKAVVQASPPPAPPPATPSSPTVQATPTPAPAPAPQRQATRGISCMVGQSMYAGDQCNGPGSSWHNSVEILSNGMAKIRYRCWVFARCTVYRSTTFTAGWLAMDKKAGGEWYIRCVAANAGTANAD